MKRFVLSLLAALLTVTGYHRCKKCDCPTVVNPPVTSQDIAAQNTAFSPAEKTIAKGTKVKWTNKDPYAHTVTSTTNLFESGNLDEGQTFEYTFNDTGTYDYYCRYHASMMRGKIIVH